MSVTVRTTRSGGSDYASVTHDRADDFQVADGHLKLLDSTQGRGRERHVAVYAPGQWIDAVVNEGDKA